MATSVADALAAVLAHAETREPQIVATDLAGGRILAQDVVSGLDLPPFPNSAMDGFAVRSRDTVASAQGAVHLAVTMESRAGRPAAGTLEPGCAARISTGAVLPEGADAVARIEDVTVDGDVVNLTEPVPHGSNIRGVGEDICRGSVVLRAGSRLMAGELAMLAAIGLTHVSVYERPSVAIVTTGDEVVPAGTPLGPGQIHESNAVMLAALAREAGATTAAITSGVGDDLDETIRALDAALDAADVVVISGGVSKGEHDHVKTALSALGARQEFWQVALRPGHPTWFGTVERDGRTRPVFGLPGNPVSAYVTFQLFVAAALARMCGSRRPVLELPATYSGPTQHKPMGMSLALRVRIDSGPYGVLAILTSPNQRSHVIASLVGTDGIALVPHGRDRVEDGDQVMVRLQR